MSAFNTPCVVSRHGGRFALLVDKGRKLYSIIELESTQLMLRKVDINKLEREGYEYSKYSVDQAVDRFLKHNSGLSDNARSALNELKLKGIKMTLEFAIQENTAAIKELISALGNQPLALAGNVEFLELPEKKLKVVPTPLTSVVVEQTPTVEESVSEETPEPVDLSVVTPPSYEVTAKAVTKVSVEKGIAAARGVLAQFGAKKLTEVAEDQFPAVIEAAELALAA